MFLFLYFFFKKINCIFYLIIFIFHIFSIEKLSIKFQKQKHIKYFFVFFYFILCVSVSVFFYSKIQLYFSINHLYFPYFFNRKIEYKIPETETFKCTIRFCVLCRWSCDFFNVYFRSHQGFNFAPQKHLRLRYDHRFSIVELHV